jgi:hypothetical protein
MPSRENANRSKKDLNLTNARKYANNNSNEPSTSFMAFPVNSSVMKLALHEVQKSARGEGPSTGRKSNKSGKDTLKSDERSKLRDLRSIFYKQSSCKNGSENKTSARNRSSSKILSKNSSTSLKNSRRSSHKRSSKILKKDVSPIRDNTLTFIDSKGKQKLLNITNPFSKSMLRGTKSRKKRVDNLLQDGVKKIKLDKIRFKSPKAHSLGKK